MTFALPIGSSASDDTIRVLAFDTTGLASVAALRAASHPRDTFNVVPNWSFEYDLDKDNIPDSWHGYGGGFIYDTTGVNAHSGTRSVHCSASIADSSHGVYTTVRLDQSAAADLTLCGWSKAANVFGNKDNNYALYVDVTYTDGTPLYGRCAQFDVGTHDWQFSTYTIKPLKPIRQLTLYCMFRSHSGDVWFDHLAVQKASAPVQNRVFHTAQPVFLGARSVCRGVLVRYETLQKEKVSVVVLDPSGPYSILWNAGNDGGRVAGSGVYLIKLVTGNRSEVAKVFLMR